MESEPKKVKNDHDSSASTSAAMAQSLLPLVVLNKLTAGVDKGFKKDFLDLSSKNIDDGMIIEICDWIIKLEGKIKTLKLQYNKISSNGAIQLFNTLREQKTAIQGILLNGNILDDGCMHSLGELIKSNSIIESIQINHNKISDKGINTLASYLAGNESLKQLHVDGNSGITEESIETLLKILETSHLNEVQLHFAGSRKRHLLGLSIAQNTLRYTGKKLILSNLGLAQKDIAEVCKMMKEFGCSKLEEVWIDDNKLETDAVVQMLRTLMDCKAKIKTLVLKDNVLDDDFLEIFCEFITQSDELKFVDIGNSFGSEGICISDEGIQMLSECLIGNTTIETFKLNGNYECTEESVPLFIEIAKRSCIRFLELAGTINYEDMNEITYLLTIPPDQREIPIKSNTKSAAKISTSASAST